MAFFIVNWDILDEFTAGISLGSEWKAERESGSSVSNFPFNQSLSGWSQDDGNRDWSCIASKRHNNSFVLCWTRSVYRGSDQDHCVDESGGEVEIKGDNVVGQVHEFDYVLFEKWREDA